MEARWHVKWCEGRPGGAGKRQEGAGGAQVAGDKRTPIRPASQPPSKPPRPSGGRQAQAACLSPHAYREERIRSSLEGVKEGPDGREGREEEGAS